jgi:hypothetical protein
MQSQQGRSYMQNKLIQVQSKLKAPKSQHNSFGGYNYRSCEDILEAVKPLLSEQGLLLTLNDELVQVGDRYYIKATASVSDGENTVSAVAYARESLEKKGQDQSQITGTASSYARKYALNGLFLIDDTKDADTDEYAKSTKSARATKEKVAPAIKNGINFQAVREKLGEIDTVDALEAYWRSLDLTPGQANILKSDFTARKVKIGVGA